MIIQRPEPMQIAQPDLAGLPAANRIPAERTHHGDAVLELISPVQLRRALSLKEGDLVAVSVYPEP